MSAPPPRCVCAMRSGLHYKDCPEWPGNWNCPKHDAALHEYGPCPFCHTTTPSPRSFPQQALDALAAKDAEIARLLALIPKLLNVIKAETGDCTCRRDWCCICEAKKAVAR